MIYLNGKKISAIFRNGQSIGKIFRNGELVWQKAKPEAKRVKSISLSLPMWGTPERIEWESILRAVPKDISNYYLDVMVKGVGVRLRGYGGKHVAELSGEVIELPESLEVTAEDVYAGQVVTVIAKVPAVMSEPTYKYSDNSFQTSATYEFADAPFLPGSSLRVELKTSNIVSLPKLNWHIDGCLNGSTMAGIAPAVTKSGGASSSVEVVYTGDDYKAMTSYGTDTWMTLTPAFYIKRSSGGKIGKVTLQSPECRLTYKFKIKKIETY